MFETIYIYIDIFIYLSESNKKGLLKVAWKILNENVYVIFYPNCKAAEFYFLLTLASPWKLEKKWAKKVAMVITKE